MVIYLFGGSQFPHIRLFFLLFSTAFSFFPYYEGRPQKHKIIIWRVGPLWYRLPPLGKCSRNPSVSVYQLMVLWEATIGFSEFYFEDSFNAFVHFMISDLRVHLPTLRWVFSSFWPKTAWPCAPPFLLIRSHPKWLFFCFPRWKKSLKGNILPMWKRWNKKRQKH